jgi:hypothetical protein
MARCPFAVWHRCPGNEPPIRPTQFIFHTAVNRSIMSVERYFCSGASGGIEAHFGVGGVWAPNENGKLRQWRDTGEQADANFRANLRPDGTGAISVETADNAPPTAAQIEPWTRAQVNTLVALGRWVHDKHGVPLRVCRNPDDPGYGWHAMWGAPSSWTPIAGKECPGPVRIAMLETIVLPRIFLADQEVPAMTEDEFKAAMRSPEVQLAITQAVQAALRANAPMGVVPVVADPATEKARGIYLLTAQGAIHADDPAVWSRLTGGKPLDSHSAIKVHPEWLVANLAHEDEAPIT